jgi:hypothetical protein
MTGGGLPWGHRPDLIIADAKKRAAASRDGKNLTHLERALWETKRERMCKLTNNDSP